MVNYNWLLQMKDIGNLNGRISVTMDVHYTCNYRSDWLILVNFVESINRVQWMPRTVFLSYLLQTIPLFFPSVFHMSIPYAAPADLITLCLTHCQWVFCENIQFLFAFIVCFCVDRRLCINNTKESSYTFSWSV